MRTIGGIESGLSGLRVDPDVILGVPTDNKKKKLRKSEFDFGISLDSPVGAAGSSMNVLGIGAGFGQKKKDNFKQAASGKLSSSRLSIITLTGIGIQTYSTASCDTTHRPRPATSQAHQSTYAPCEVYPPTPRRLSPNYSMSLASTLHGSSCPPNQIPNDLKGYKVLRGLFWT